MRTLAAVVLLLLAHQMLVAQPTCIPNGFSATYDNSICFGYAQGRAFGCSSGEAAIINASTISWSHFNYVSGIDLAGIMVGDIVVWSNGGLVDPSHGHAAYVSAVTQSEPVGKFRIGSNGQVGDINPPTPFANVTLDHVPGAGAAPVLGVSFTSVHQSRTGTYNDVFKGVYRLKTPSETSTPATYQVTVQNSFGSGQILVGKKGTNFINHTSPFVGYFPYNAQVQAKAFSQVHNGVQHDFFWWEKNSSYLTGSAEIVIVGAKSANTFTAYFEPSSSANYMEFENRLGSTSIGGIITVNGSNRHSRTERFPVGSATVSALPSMQVDRVQYTFVRWELNGNTYSTNATISPTGAGLYVALYTFNYINPPAEITPYNNPVGQPIKITWLKHTSDFASQIQIWRKVKNVHGPMVIATLSGSATSFTDYEYTLTSGYTDDLIDYDVRVKYSLTGAYSSPYWFTVFGSGGMAKGVAEKDRKLPNGVEDAPTELTLGAYPNPFNPSTNVVFGIPEEAHVEVTIFDLQGRVVASPIQRRLSAGRHSFTWNATDKGGAALPSGMYIVRIAAFSSLDGTGSVLYRKLQFLK